MPVALSSSYGKLDGDPENIMISSALNCASPAGNFAARASEDAAAGTDARLALGTDILSTSLTYILMKCPNCGVPENTCDCGIVDSSVVMSSCLCRGHVGTRLIIAFVVVLFGVVAATSTKGPPPSLVE